MEFISDLTATLYKCVVYTFLKNTLISEATNIDNIPVI